MYVQVEICVISGSEVLDEWIENKIKVTLVSDCLRIQKAGVKKAYLFSLVWAAEQKCGLPLRCGLGLLWSYIFGLLASAFSILSLFLSLR